MKARVIANPYDVGNGYYPVGQIVEIERETANYYVLVNSCYRINKAKMALTGWAGRYAHTIEFEIIEAADEPRPVSDVNTEILIGVAETSSREGARRIVAEALEPLGQVADIVDPISENVCRLYARLPVGVAVREALDLLYPLEFVLTAYPLGAQDMIPAQELPSLAPVVEPRDAWRYQGGLHGEDYKWTRDEWSREVEAGNTQRGYWDWVEAQIEENEDAADQEVRDALATGAIVVMVARELVDADILADLGGWLNTNGLDSNFAVFPGDMTEILGPISPENAAQLKREALAYIDEQTEDQPRAAVSVSDYWNGQPVKPLDWIDVLRDVGASCSGFALDLGGTIVARRNELVISWDKSPGEPVEKITRAAVIRALDDRYPPTVSADEPADEPAAAMVCRLTLAVPEAWNGDKVPRDLVAAWCADQSKGFKLALMPIPCAAGGVVVTWASGSAPSNISPTWQRDLEAGAINFLNSLAEDFEPAEPAERTRLSLAVPITWRGDQIDRDALAAWVETMGKQWPASVWVVLAERTNRLDVGATLDHAGGPTPSAELIDDILADVGIWLSNAKYAQ